jgi:phosphonate degradation associated HDIG domain protein
LKLTDELFELYQGRGDGAYFGEAVTVTEHCLQAAHFATLAGAAEALVVAALLHDIGHLVEAVPDDIDDWTKDARHELVGSRWLAQRFEPAVSEPVRLHVPAKRYLCATDPAYFGKLSAASVRTLDLQGGPMRSDEVSAFEAEAFSRDALLVRRCDDQGKVAGLRVPSFDHYRVMIERLAVRA